MIDQLKRFREPAAIVALLVVLFQSGATVVRFVVEARRTPVTTVMRGTTGLFGLVDAMVLTVLVLACLMVAPVTRRARLLTLTSAVVMALGAAAGLVLTVGALIDPAGWFSRLLESIGGIAEVVFKALFAWLLWHGYRAVVASAAEAAAPAPVVAEQTPVPPDPTRKPTWAAEAATGVVWRRAGDAASGAAATAVGEHSAGWTPAPMAQLPAVRPDGALLPPVPGDPVAEALAASESGPAPGRAVRVIVGDDEGPAAGRTGPPSWVPDDPAPDAPGAWTERSPRSRDLGGPEWDPTDDVSRPGRGL